MKPPLPSPRKEHQAPRTPTPPTQESAGLPAPSPRDDGSKEAGGRKRAGRPKGRKKLPYNVLMYITRNDLREAVKVLNEKVKTDRDRVAAQYIIDQACGTAVNRKEVVNPNQGARVIIVLPPKMSEAGALAGYRVVELPEKSSAEEAKMERLLGKTPARLPKASGKGQST